MFVIFKKKGKNYYFEKIKFWNMPYKDIEDYVKPVYNTVKDYVANGNIVKKVTKNKYITNFPAVIIMEYVM